MCSAGAQKTLGLSVWLKASKWWVEGSAEAEACPSAT